LLLIYRELNILCVKYSLYSPYGDDVIKQDGASSRCHITDTIVAMALSRVVSEIFNVEKYRATEIPVKG